VSWYLGLTLVVLFAAGLLFLVLYAIVAIIQEYRDDRVPVLLYHHFIPKAGVEKQGAINCDPVYACYDTAFDEQMAYLQKEGYAAISLDHFIAFQDGKKPLPPKPVILTFDDGFMSNYLYAFPILKKYGMTATIFVTLDPGCENFRKYGSIDSPLTRDQIREMSDYGISMQSHTMTHRYLTELDPKIVRWELGQSKRDLERIVQKRVRFLAIPTGAYNRGVKRLVKEVGYKAAFCMLKGTNNSHSDRYALRRLVVARDFAIEDFQKLLKPATACYLRITSLLQNVLFNTLLGPAKFDALRDRLYHTRVGSLLARAQLRYVAACLAALMFCSLILGIVILVRS